MQPVSKKLPELTSTLVTVKALDSTLTILVSDCPILTLTYHFRWLIE